MEVTGDSVGSHGDRKCALGTAPPGLGTRNQHTEFSGREVIAVHMPPSTTSSNAVLRTHAG